MAGDVMKKVQPGDKLKIPAETFNTFLDTARAFRAGQQNLGVVPRPELRDRNILLVKNSDAGEKDWTPFSPVVVTAPGGAPASWAFEFSAKPYLSGNQPTGNNRRRELFKVIRFHCFDKMFPNMNS